jgi:hypothetical protein
VQSGPSSTSGFSVVAVDNTTGAVGTPVVVSASDVPKIMFKITSTTAIVFYGNGTSGTLIAAVVSLSGATTLSVGTASSTLTDVNVGLEDMSSDPKIAQLSTTLYLVSYGENAVDNSVAAFQVSGGTTVNLGAAVTLVVSGDAISGTTTYALTATTGLVLYKRNPGPYINYGVVVSVTNANPPVCTVGTAVSMTGVNSSTASRPASCLLSATKCLLMDNNNTSGSNIVNVFTISSTTITVGTLVSVETGLVTNVVYGAGNRYRPVLFPLTATTALLNYSDNTVVSRAVVLTEAATVVTAGTIIYGTIARATASPILPPTATGFLSYLIRASAALSGMIVPSKISGTTITTGSTPLILTNGALSGPTAPSQLANGTYVLPSVIGIVHVINFNGDVVVNKGSIDIQAITPSATIPSPVAGNRVVYIGTDQEGSALTTRRFRVINLEIAS